MTPAHPYVTGSALELLILPLHWEVIVCSTCCLVIFLFSPRFLHLLCYFFLASLCFLCLLIFPDIPFLPIFFFFLFLSPPEVPVSIITSIAVVSNWLGTKKKGNPSQLSILALCSHFSLPSSSVLVHLVLFLYPSSSSLPQACSKKGKEKEKSPPPLRRQ